MNKKGIIFDLDGVIISTDHFHYLAWKAIADSEAIPFDEEINNRLRGVSRLASLEIILEKASRKYSPKEKEALCEKKNELYRESLKALTPASLDESVLNTLRELKRMGIKLAIGSASKNTAFILERIGLSSFFDEVVDGTMISHSKPDPEVFLLAASKLGLDASECAVVEDAKAGVEAAKKGGFVSFGLSDAKESEFTDYPLEKFSDLLLHFSSSPRIKIEHLYKTYPNGVTAIKDFNLEINDEEFVVFVGPSGCGKSTVLRMIAGLEDVTSGSIYLDGNDITDKEAKDRNIAMVFQNYALYPHLSVFKNIAFPLEVERVPLRHFFDFKYRKKRKEEIKSKVYASANKIGLSEYLDRKPANLSGGQRQRVALGRAIVRDPEVFLLDEPLSNLDAKMRVAMRSEITRLHDKLKTIFVYVTHDQVEAMTMGSKIVVLKDGLVQQIGTPEDIFLNPLNIFVAGFIGTPQMNFFDAVISKDDGKHYASFLNGDSLVPLDEKRMATFDDSYLGKIVTMGVRPKAISVTGDLSYCEQGYLAKINLFEQLGEETLVYASIGGKEDELLISTEGLGRFKKGQEIGVSFRVNQACFFDKENGKSLL
jgi:multiple sugar transport system ATP-binding protein